MTPPPSLFHAEREPDKLWHCPWGRETVCSGPTHRLPPYSALLIEPSVVTTAVFPPAGPRVAGSQAVSSLLCSAQTPVLGETDIAMANEREF